MSVGAGLGASVRVLGLPIVPSRGATARVVLVDPADLPDAGVLGPLDAIGPSTAAAPQVWVLAVPVPDVGWLLSVAQPAGLLDLVADAPRAPTLTVSFHAGRSSADTLLAQARATVPPPPPATSAGGREPSTPAAIP